VRTTLIALLWVAACGQPSGGGDGGSQDLSTSANKDMPGGGGDMVNANTMGIACASMSCIAMGQNCCTSDYGKTGMCQSAGNPVCQGGFPYGCDGPEDCPPAEPECCAGANGSTCRAAGICETMGSIGFVMCHNPGQCPTVGSNCCPGPGGAPYRLCAKTCM
jgi:hypothetical protein